jgi:circadian clock protein KaiC
VSTSLLQGAQPLTEETPVQISTIADTWIHLTNISRAGERNRALSIVKSRGMKHSNQVRELILSDEGIALADVYTAAGDLLMGTARWQEEAAEKTEQERILAEVEHKRSEVAPTIPGWSWPLDFSHGVGLLPLPVEPCASRLGH